MAIKETLNQIIFRIIFVFSYQITTLLSLPILANNLSSIEFGKIMTCLVLFQIAIFVSEWGTPFYSIENYSKKYKKKELRDFLIKILSFNFQWIIFFSLLFFLLFEFVFNELSFLYFIFLLPNLIFGILNTSWFYILLKKIEDILLVTIFSRFLFLYFVYYFIDSDKNGIYFFIFQGFSFFIIAIYSLYVIKKKYIKDLVLRLGKFQFDYLKNSLSFFSSNLFDNYFCLIWVFLIAVLLGPLTLSIYTIPDQILRGSIAISILISQTVRLNYFDATKKIFRVFFIIFFISIVCLFIVLTYYAQILEFFFDSKHYQAILISRDAILVAFVHFVVRLLNYPVCGRFCNVVFLNKISSLVFIFNIINLFFWIIFSRDVNNVFLFMSISLVLHLVILIILIIKNKYKHYLSIPN